MRLLFVIVFLSAASASGQVLTATEFRKELAVVQQQFSRSNSFITYKRELLISGEDTTSEAGTFLRGEGLNYRLSQTGVLIVQNSQGKLIIDSAQHTVVLTIVDSLFSLMDTPDLTDENVARVYVLSKNAGKSFNTFYMTPKSEGIEKAEIRIPVSGISPVTMKVTLPPGNYVSHSLDDESIEEPVLTITYTSVKTAKPAKSEFTFDNYLKTENGKPALAAGFPADYTFYDLRPASTK